MLKKIINNTKQKGVDFCNQTVQSLCKSTGADFTFIGVLSDDKKSINTLSICSKEKLVENQAFILNDSLSNTVLEGSFCSYDNNVKALFPKDDLLNNFNIAAYAGYPLFSTEAQSPIGILVSLYKDKISGDQENEILRVFENYAPCIEIEIESGFLRSIGSLTNNIQKVKNVLNVLTENSLENFLLVGLDSRINYINKVGKDDTKEKVIGSSIYDFVPEDERGELKSQFDNVVKTKSSNIYNLSTPLTSGGFGYYEAHLSPIIENKEVVIVLINIRNITNQKVAELQLRDSEERFRGLSNLSLEGVAITENGVILDANNATANLFGYSIEELIGMNTTNHLLNEKSRIKVEGLRKNNNEEPYEIEVVRKGGEVIEVEAQTKMIQYQGRQAWVTVFRNITERNKIENTLKESEEKLRLITQNSSENIMLISKDQKILFINKVPEGIIKDDIIGKQMLDYAPEEYKAIADDSFNFVISKGEATGYQSTFNLPNGGVLYYDIKMAPVLHNGIVDSVVVSARDITDRRQFEIALADSEKRYKELSSLSLEGIIINRAGLVLDVNKAACVMFGYSYEELIGMNGVQTLVIPELVPFVKQKITDKVEIPYEVKMLRKDGVVLDVEVQAKRILYKGEEARVTIFRDITEGNKIKNTLIESQEKYRKLIDLSPDPIAITQDGVYQFVNKAFCDLFEYSEEEIYNNFHFIGLLPEEVQEEIKEGYGNWTGEDSDKINHTLQLKTKTGILVMCETSTVKIEYEGLPAEMAIMHDITARNRVAEALQNSETKYKRIFNSLIDVYFRTDKLGKLIELSPSAENVFGYKVSELLGQNSKDFYKFPDQLKKVLKQLKENKEIPNYSLTLINRSGEEINVEGYSMVVTDSNNEFVGVEGMIRDVTRRIRVENELKLQNNEEANQRIYHFIRGQEDERKRVARELHDSIGQELTSMKMMVDDFSNGYSVEKQKSLTTYINSVLGEVKQISDSLSPSILVELGLKKSISRLCADLEQKSGTPIKLYMLFDEKKIKSIELDIYRILQESLNNAIKYAKASEIQVQLILIDNKFRLLIEDDGLGFEQKEVKYTSRGLSNMKDRTTSIKGELFIDTTIGQGTTISIEIPII